MLSTPTGTHASAGGRVAALDGLRALSILMVLWSHAPRTAGFPRGGFFTLAPLGDLGNLGVRIFFVISGYLITSLMVDEIARTGRVDLRAFYLRRVLRIFPAFYVYLAVIGVVAMFGVVPLALGDLLLAATYTVNFQPLRAWHVGHIWSLSVEEQFYLLWPAVLSAVGLVKGMRVAVAVLLAAPLCRLGIWFFLPSDRAMIGEAFPTIADALAVGCLLAAARGVLDRAPRYQAALRSPAFVIVPVVALAINAEAAHARAFLSVGESVLDVCIAIAVDRVVRCPDAISTRLLASAPAVFIGKRSYSLYLWQQPFFDHAAPSFFTTFPQNVGLCAIAAMASYHLVELPFLGLRHRFGLGAQRRSEGARVPAPAPPTG